MKLLPALLVLFAACAAPAADPSVVADDAGVAPVCDEADCVVLPGGANEEKAAQSWTFTTKHRSGRIVVDCWFGGFTSRQATASGSTEIVGRTHIANGRVITDYEGANGTIRISAANNCSWIITHDQQR